MQIPLDEQECPRCKTNKFRNPSMTLHINICGHSLCDVCVHTLFTLGTGNCPTCSCSLRKNNFRLQYFDSPSVEREVEVRRKILRDFNLRPNDFHSQEEYDNYLETVEDIIYNIVNNVNVDRTKKRIEECRKRNRSKILKNRSTLSADQEAIERLLDEERKTEILRKKARTDERDKMMKVRNQLRTDLLEKLESNEDVNAIVDNIDKNIKELGQNVKQDSLSAFSQLRKKTASFLTDETPLFIFTRKPSFNIYGPPDVHTEMPANSDLTCSFEHIAGGYSTNQVYHRSVQAALLCLNFVDLKEAKKMSMNNFVKEEMRKSISKLCLAFGFSGIASDSLDVLEDISFQFIKRMCNSFKTLQESGMFDFANVN
ncbi:hypothetical protein GJ496_004223 [Pomphorhynchus laevis]|nr:hypothetical protein GJ496_004223 [Pomphorhynchus laevis]